MKEFSIKTFGNSMFPFFIDGDILNVRKVSSSRIKVDDFITLKSGKKYITHRVVFKNPKDRFLITKGDSNYQPDGKVFPKQILGKVISIKRKFRHISINDLCFLQSTLYFQEITKIKRDLLNNEINFVILKGLPLHLYFERKIPSRIYADCDILIDKQQLFKVGSIFRKMGYHRTEEVLSPAFKKLKDKEVEIQYKKTINGIPVTFDIHLEAVFLMTQLGSLEFLYPQKLLGAFTALLLSNQRKIKLNNEYFPILKNELLVIYLSLHLFHHNFQGYYRYELIKKIIQTQKIDFKKMAEVIKVYKLQNFIYPVFLVLKKYYSVLLPTILNTNSKKYTSKYIKTRILTEDIFRDETRVSSGIKRFKNIFFLSSEPMLKKILIVFNPQVLYAIYFSIFKTINLFYLRNNFLLKQKVGKLF